MQLIKWKRHPFFFPRENQKLFFISFINLTKLICMSLMPLLFQWWHYRRSISMNRINTRKFFIASLAALVAFGTGVVLSTNSNLIKSEALYSPGTTYTVTSPAAYYSSINDSVTGTSLLSALQSLNSSNRRKRSVIHRWVLVQPTVHTPIPITIQTLPFNTIIEAKILH